MIPLFFPPFLRWLEGLHPSVSAILPAHNALLHAATFRLHRLCLYVKYENDFGPYCRMPCSGLVPELHYAHFFSSYENSRSDYNLLIPAHSVVYIGDDQHCGTSILAEDAKTVGFRHLLHAAHA